MAREHYKHGGEHDLISKLKHESMHHEKKHRKTGGRAEFGDGEGRPDEDPDVTEVYAGKGSNVDRESRGEMRKKGGKVKKVVRKKGGKVERFEAKIEGEAKKHRADKPARKRGGGVGSDTNPLTTANTETDRRGPNEGDEERGIAGES